MKRRRTFTILFVVCLICLIAGVALAQSGGTRELRQFTIDGGGGISSSGTMVVRGTIGQADAGSLSGGDFVLHGGFWRDLRTELYLPMVIHNNTVR